MNRAVLAAVMLGVLVGSFAAAAPPMPRAPAGEKSFTTDPEFQGRITVRAAGLTLLDLLPRLGRLADNPLAASPEIAEKNVAVFAEGLPAGEVLDALTAMLNMTPEGGYSWSSSGRGAMRLKSLMGLRGWDRCRGSSGWSRHSLSPLSLGAPTSSGRFAPSHRAKECQRGHTETSEIVPVCSDRG